MNELVQFSSDVQGGSDDAGGSRPARRRSGLSRAPAALGGCAGSTSLGRPTRRAFLAGAGAAAWALSSASAARSLEASAALELGMIGCGGRGNWIADLFLKNASCRFVACADYYPDRANSFGERFGVPASRRHTALSGYRRLLDGKLDAVVIETPPYFHPEQAAAAVDAGRHVFIAKPIAVDVPGCRTIDESGAKATANRLVFLVDYQTRNNEHYREAARRVHAGDIGELVCGEARYPWAGGRGGAPANPEDRLRLWYCIRALSGDFIIEQNVHTLDVATWFIDADPLKAHGAGGSKGLRTYGDIWDHFSAIFTFPGDVVLSFNSVQAIPGVPDAIPCRIYGTKGVVDTDYFSHVWIRGEKPYAGGQLPGLYTTGAVNNIKDFCRFIEEGRCGNETVKPSVRSNLTAILGRTAAYRRRTVTWDEMMAENERLVLDLEGLKS